MNCDELTHSPFVSTYKIFNIGKPISGPELAMLLEILVTAANEGSLAEVLYMLTCEFFNSMIFKIPGRWEVFISELRLNALEDCIVYYESDMMLLIQMNDIGKYSSSYYY